MNKEIVPTVSVITPAYNAARFIRDTIESVQSQTYNSWEMIIVDDCSSDNTCDIVEEKARHDNRIRLIRQTENGGPARARNSALKAATGRYIAFLDSDDLWLPEKLERQLAFVQKHEAVLSFTQYRRISITGDQYGKLITIPSTIDYRGLLKNTAIATSTVIIDRKKSGPFEMVGTFYDDFVLWLDLLKRGIIAHGLQEDLMRYRIVGKSVSRNKLKSALWVWRTYRNIEKLSPPYSAWCFLNYAIRACIKYKDF